MTDLNAESLVLEAHELRSRLVEAESDLAAASRDAYVLFAAHAHGIDPVQLAKTHGSTREQIESNAARLSGKHFNGGTAPASMYPDAPTDPIRKMFQ